MAPSALRTLSVIGAVLLGCAGNPQQGAAESSLGPSGADSSGAATTASTAGPGSGPASESVSQTSDSGNTASSTAPTGTDTTGLPDACSNRVQDGQETDVDCGGPQCLPCELGQGCVEHTDCESTACDQETGFCADVVLAIWLDASAFDTMFQDLGCTIPISGDGAPVYCWENRGAVVNPGVLAVGLGTYQAGRPSVTFNGDVLTISNAFDGAVDDVAIYLVQAELNGTNSFDFNLNHPIEDAQGRYSAHIPWNNDRTVSWDPGDNLGARVQTAANIIDVGETHLFAFFNSASKNVRSIVIDGGVVDEAAGANPGIAATFSLARGADLRVHEVRVYRPAPGPQRHEDIEGELACKWDLRNQLPQGHPYYDQDGGENEGCP